jgi:Protein of unknown function (DUF1566)
MKRFLGAILIVFLGNFAIAGGDVVPEPYIEPTKPCNSGAVYIQKKENLMWQDEVYHDDEESAYRNSISSGKAGNWEHVRNYCATLYYGGFSDWRLPTLEEMMDLHQRPSGLKNSIASDFWTSTPDKGDKYKTLYTADGFPYVHKKNESHFVRCVRCLEDKNAPSHPASNRK